jgi:HPt (histidine-containing phosphotransfer) domain-containing protein
MDDSEKLTIVIDSELEDILPGYLKNREKDLLLIPQALEKGDYEKIRTLGHRMKGSGSGYGLPAITDIGTALEKAAIAEDSEQIFKLVTNLTVYLDRVEIIYQEFLI